MCRTLELIPLFIARQMPKSYILEVTRQDGFCLLMGYQFYPFAHQSLAKIVRDNLELPVDCPSRIADGTFQRFLNWHLKQI
jgi:hypothetical protein